MRRLAVVLLLAALGACGGSDAESARPVTTAHLEILEPLPSAVTGPDVTVIFKLTGAHIVPQAKKELRPDEGHIHLYLDNTLVSMNYTERNDLKGLSPGPHTVRGDFVAADHGPFRNPPVAASVFKVEAAP